MPEIVLRALYILISIMEMKKCLLFHASLPFSKYQKCHPSKKVPKVLYFFCEDSLKVFYFSHY